MMTKEKLNLKVRKQVCFRYLNQPQGPGFTTDPTTVITTTVTSFDF